MAKQHSGVIVAGALMSIASIASAGSGSTWSTVVNNGQLMPDSTKLFNSYNQPSIDPSGLVVFRARSKGPGQPVRGIYARDMSVPAAPVTVVAAVGGEVPQPNNTPSGGNGLGLATFLEFPSFPRIDVGSRMMATRAQTQPTWTYLLADGSESRIGTAGIYGTVGGVLSNGACLLGGVRDAATDELVFPWWQVPGATEGTRFDQFPGAASPCDAEFVVFKGNWTDAAAATGRTGVYFRSMTAMGGMAPVQRIADSQMPIPGQVGPVLVPFGSTAPPSAAYGQAVFLGLDNEESPTLGGIYRASLVPDPPLEPVALLGDQVPGEAPEAAFTRMGEALSFDGRWVAFWASWGTETRSITLECPVDGNSDIVKFCNEQYPDGFVVEVPVNQGFFVADTLSGQLHAIAKTGSGIDDMMYWNFSGSPGTGGDEGGDQEPPRWRSTSFIAVDSTGPGAYRAVFKAKMGTDDVIATRTSAPGQPTSIVVSTQTAGTDLDAQAPAGSLVSAIGIERDGLRNGRLALTASMLNETTGEAWAGIYFTTLPPVDTCPADLDGDGEVDAHDLAELLDSWGSCDELPADLNGDGAVDAIDLAILLSAWGECP